MTILLKLTAFSLPEKDPFLFFSRDSHSADYFYCVKLFNLSLLLLTSLLLRAQSVPGPDLQCVLDDPLNGNVVLHWSPSPNQPCGTFVGYDIWGSDSGNPFTLISTVNTQSTDSFVHAGALNLGAIWCYFIIARFNCPGAAFIASDTVCNRPPLEPEIQSVTVTESGQVVMTWYPGTEPQTQSYVVYYYLPSTGLGIPITTVPGRFDTTYTDISTTALNQSLIYTIASQDSCGQISPFSLLPHNTIHLTAQTSTCEENINLNWNRYINWPEGVAQYQIWGNVNQTGWQNVGSVDSATTTFNFTQFEDGDSVCIYILAISAENDSIRSASNRVCLRPSIVNKPDYLFISQASVELNGDLSLNWLIDPDAELFVYQIKRSGDNQNFTTDQFPVPSPLNAVDFYSDTTALTSSQFYYYKIGVVDSCQNKFNSPYVKTIHLLAEQYDQYTIQLTWNRYELFGSNVVEQRIYRDFGNGIATLLATVDSSVTFYEDIVRDYLDQAGQFCYRIEAVYDLNLPDVPFIARLNSFSNYLCLDHRPVIYIPNAFAPEGVNAVFKPTLIYGEPADYRMIIYNRYGGKVFETTEPTTGWDGRIGGKVAQQGGYAYHITFTAADGTLVERQGIVLLVRN